MRLDRGGRERAARAALAYTAVVGRPASPVTAVLLNAIGAAAGAWAPGAWRSSSPCPTACRPTRPPGPGHIVKARYTPACSRCSSASTSRTARTTTLLRRRRRPRRDAGGRRRPALGPAGGAGRAPGGAARGPGRLRHDRRRRPARGLLPHGVEPARRRLARRDHHRRAGLRRRPRGGQRAHRPARRRATSCAPTSPSWPRGPGNVGTGTRWGFSGACAGRGAQRRRTSSAAARWPRCGSRRPTRATAPPRHLAPQPHGIRPGRAGARRRARCRRLDRGVRRARARSRRRTWSAPAGGRLTLVEVAVDGLRRRARHALRCACRRWAVGWTRTPRRSSRRPLPARYAARGRKALSRPDRGGTAQGCAGCAQRTSTRSTTKISVSPGLIAPPAPRSP